MASGSGAQEYEIVRRTQAELDEEHMLDYAIAEMGPPADDPKTGKKKRGLWPKAHFQSNII